MNIDYWPVQKATFSAGATWRVVPSIDVHAAFAYTVNETVDVALGEGRVREVVVIDPGLVANEGRYTSTLYTASIQGNYKF
jgi:long-subunit fatty acid transport protein